VKQLDKKPNSNQKGSRNQSDAYEYKDYQDRANHKFALTYSYMGMYYSFVPRASTTSDAFNAVAEPRRREILVLLASREWPVGDIVVALRLGQPSVSKHLRVLRQTGLVRTRRNGRQILYRTDPQAIRPLYEWTKTFERFWRRQLERVKERAEAQAQKQSDAPQ
jgi:DNA-binding transcriptional ArsR family regulator